MDKAIATLILFALVALVLYLAAPRRPEWQTRMLQREKFRQKMRQLKGRR